MMGGGGWPRQCQDDAGLWDGRHFHHKFSQLFALSDSLSTASPTHLRLCAIPFQSLPSPRDIDPITPRPRRRSVACQDVLVALLVGHHRNPSPSSALVCCIASAERYLTQDPSRKRRRGRQALAPAAFGGCTTGQAPRRCCGDRSKTDFPSPRHFCILCTEYRGAMQWPPIWPPPLI